MTSFMTLVILTVQVLASNHQTSKTKMNKMQNVYELLIKTNYELLINDPPRGKIAMCIQRKTLQGEYRHTRLKSNKQFTQYMRRMEEFENQPWNIKKNTKCLTRTIKVHRAAEENKPARLQAEEM